MKKILGLDLGTNSIGWALVNQDVENGKGNIISAGSRIIPMSQEILGEFDKGNSISQTAERTGFRGVRRIRERFLLRRERLHRVLNQIGFLPSFYATQIDFEKHYGQFKEKTEPKLAYDGNTNFIFKDSFEEMLKDFAIHQPLLVANGKKVPYDWTIYFLRKKALTEKITREELAWLLLNFNQKRGYFQLRGEEDEEIPNKKVEFHELKVVKVEATEDRKKDDIWYNVILENGWIYRRSSKEALFDWVGKTKEFIVTTDLNEDGSIKTDKDGKEKRSFKAVNSEEDWIAIKKSTEEKIERSNKTVGCYIYETMLQKPEQKINGKLIRTIERKFYKAELKSILEKQKEFHSELQDETLYRECLEELYQYNEAHKSNIEKYDFTYLFINDILFYQRPLKSKKSLISNCRFESRSYKNEDGTLVTLPIKCIAKSHPLFQEFRLWQWMMNLKIYLKDNDKEVTAELLKTEEDWVNLFKWLNERKEVDQKAFLKYPGFNLKKETAKYRWNFVEDKTYPCNETRSMISTRLVKAGIAPDDFLTNETEEALWHILYSVENKNEIEKAIKSFGAKHHLGNEFEEQFVKFPPFKKEYGSYSAKAIKKILPLMRLGSYWNEESIHLQTQERIGKLLSGEFDEKIRNRVREKAIALSEISHFKGLPLWLTTYIIYDRHSEDGEVIKWHTANDIQLLEQHSLRNPIVEQVINETLLVVRDIWNAYGEGKEDFIDEIHIELGREMKNPAERRKQMTSQNTENENTNLRIRALLAEMQSDSSIENVRAYSPSQQEILKIYEDGVLYSQTEIPEDILKISKAPQPSKTELNRYKLWLEQKYRSPYTGVVIPLSKLFTPAYEIEHIIPQSRYFDDSFSNKVICEAEVNKLKDNQLGFEFIKKHRTEKVALNYGRTVGILTEEAYQDFIKTNYASPKSRGKRNKLLMEDIPESFIQRQLNDSRYISKVVKNLMSNIVRAEDEQETTSKNVLSSNGTITSVLKQDWGLNEIWNEIIEPRFTRLNGLTNSNRFGKINKNTGKFLPEVPLELLKGFNKKRIDHRHHTMDAIVIACATRNHINYLNNESAKADKKNIRFELRNKLCFKKFNDGSSDNYKWIFQKPWKTFTEEAKETLLNTLVSFKQNLRVINKTSNYYQNWVQQNDGTRKREIVKQTKGDNWAVRKPLNKETVSGLVKLKFKKNVSLSVALENAEMITDKSLKQKINELKELNKDKKQIVNYFKDTEYEWNKKDVSRVDIYYWDNENVASRVKIDESFNSEKIKSVTDTGIQNILMNHLKNYEENRDGKITEHPEMAFSADGIESLNKNILLLNQGKLHQPIYKVRTYEPKGNKYIVGSKGNKKDKYVEAAKGTNLFFAIYADEDGKRSYETLPLNIVIERLKQGLKEVPEISDKGSKLLFHLSPNDLVYIPTKDEDEAGKTGLLNNRIYKVVSFTGNRLYCIQHNIAKSIIDKIEFTLLNKLESDIESNLSIKQVCYKLKVDRLGRQIQ
jgi:CRISPR-associated endonuclease Csn1